MTASYSWSQFENSIKELSPYVKEKLVEATHLRNMSEIERCLKECYHEDEKFKKLVNEVFGEYLNKVVPSDKRIAKKILDIDLWFLTLHQLHRKLGKIKIERKFTGRLLEIVAESVLKAYLNREKLSYEFVDYDPVDYVILNNDNVICEISCKTVLSTNKTIFDYKEHAKTVAKRLEGQKKKFAVFCGCGQGEKKTIRDEFDKINNCKLFYLWVRTGWTSDAYTVDESFCDFIDFIKNLQ